MSEVQLTLLAHLLCPFAERAALVASYKGVLGIMQEISTAEKPEILTQANPLGKVPTLIATKGDKTYNIYETVVVASYLAGLPGPKLLPTGADDQPDLVAKSALMSFLLTQVDTLIGKFFGLLRGGTPENREEFKELLRLANRRLEGAQFFGKAAYGVDELSLADIFYFTPLERFYAVNGVVFDDLTVGEDFGNLNAWFERMKSFEWAQPVIQPPSRYVNQFNKIIRGEHRGLEMPLSFYD